MRQIGTGFINLDRYLSANQQGAADTAKTALDDVHDKTDISSDLASEQKQFNATLDASKNAATWTGPKSMADFDPKVWNGMQTKSLAADTLGASMNTDAGRASYFRQAHGYGGGSAALDGYLSFAASPDGFSNLPKWAQSIHDTLGRADVDSKHAAQDASTQLTGVNPVPAPNDPPMTPPQTPNRPSNMGGVFNSNAAPDNQERMPASDYGKRKKESDRPATEEY